MDPSSLLPLTGLAAGLAGEAVEATRRAGEAFADVLAGKAAEDQSPAADHATDGSETPGEGTLRTDQLTELARRHAGELHDALAKRFAELGISTTSTVTLGLDAFGDVRVFSDHPDADRIERLFAETPRLKQAVRFLATTHQLLRESTRAAAYDAATHADPASAAREFDDLFSPSQESFRLTYTASGVEASFEE